MSDLLIKGMEMPTEDEEILIRIDSNGTVMTEYALPITGVKAVSIQEPHGRLGDLDELKTAFPCGESIRTESVRATIDHMPTIIQASTE